MFCLEKLSTHTHEYIYIYIFQYKMPRASHIPAKYSTTQLHSHPPFLHIISGDKSRFISISLLITVKGVSYSIQHQLNTYCVSSIVLSLYRLSQSHLTLALQLLLLTHFIEQTQGLSTLSPSISLGPESGFPMALCYKLKHTIACKASYFSKGKPGRIRSSVRITFVSVIWNPGEHFYPRQQVLQSFLGKIFSFFF